MFQMCNFVVYRAFYLGCEHIFWRHMFSLCMWGCGLDLLAHKDQINLPVPWRLSRLLSSSCRPRAPGWARQNMLGSCLFGNPAWQSELTDKSHDPTMSLFIGQKSWNKLDDTSNSSAHINVLPQRTFAAFTFSDKMVNLAGSLDGPRQVLCVVES